jgi:hypothetical protein
VRELRDKIFLVPERWAGGSIENDFRPHDVIGSHGHAPGGRAQRDPPAERKHFPF